MRPCVTVCLETVRALRYDEVQVAPSTRREFDRLEARVRRRLAERYRLTREEWGPIGNHLRYQAERLMEVSDRPLPKLALLDLGCGAPGCPDYGGSRHGEPWLCRFVHALGGRATGIDLIALDEPFVARVADLRSHGSLDFIPDHCMDVANAFFLFNSPTLMMREVPRSDLVAGRWTGAGSRLFDHLQPQLDRILRPRAVFVYDGEL